MHLPLHLFLSLLGVTMINAIRLGENREVQQVVGAGSVVVLRGDQSTGFGTAAKASESAVAVSMSLQSIALAMFALTGALHIFSALIKVMNTYQNDGTLL